MSGVVPAAVRHDEQLRRGLHSMAELAVAVIDGCERAAVVVADDEGRFEAMADIGELDVGAEAVVDAVRSGRSQCVETPESWMAVPLLVGRDVLGVFALSGPTGVFAGRRAQRLGDDMAQHAALALAAACLVATRDQLSAAVDEARDVIDQAHGVIMARSRCGAEVAAARLAADAVRQGHSLAEMAAKVVASTQPG